MIRYLQISHSSYNHGSPRACDGDHGGRHPVTNRQRRIYDGQGRVPIASERAVILRYTVQYRFLRTKYGD